MKPQAIHPRRLRRAWTGAAALLLLLTAGAEVARADERRGDRGERREIAASQRHGDHDRHRRHDRYRHDRHRRHDQYRHDRHRRHDQYRHDRHRRHDQYRHDRYRRHDRYGHHGDRRYQRHDYRHRYFDVPRAIAHHRHHHYRPYHHGRVYYPGHRHHHDVYRFPAYTEWGVEYYPYAYCEGSFFARGVFRGGRALFDIHIGF